jgi:DNA-binding Lrp family transcriptional regulator
MLKLLQENPSQTNINNFARQFGLQPETVKNKLLK